MTVEAPTNATMRSSRTPPGRTTARRVLPWFGSILGHALLLGFILLLGWNIAENREEKSTPLITAELDPSFDVPLETLQPVQEGALEPLAPLPIEVEATLDSRSFAPPSSSARIPGGLGASAPTSLGNVSFAGLAGGSARRIVFVVDASGSMVGAFPVVIAELTRSLSNLSPAQSYAVIFFQGDKAVVVPPKRRLTPATEEDVARTIQWIRKSVVPSGRSNPIEAIEEALDLKPEVVFMLSSNITGSGRYEVDLDALMGQLEDLNPADPASGMRPTTINCIQFLDPDPLDALREIASKHGTLGSDGRRSGYRFLGREELGLAPGR